MKLLLDEDSQGRIVIRLLREAGHDVMTVREAGLDGHSDLEVFAFARQEQRAILTRNVGDFLALHAREPAHPDILLEYQGRYANKNMKETEIVQAIGNIEASSWEIAGQCLALNAWNISIKSEAQN